MAIDYDEQLLPAYRPSIPGRPRPNTDQRDGILSPSDALFLVAGPGPERPRSAAPNPDADLLRPGAAERDPRDDFYRQGRGRTSVATARLGIRASDRIARRQVCQRRRSRLGAVGRYQSGVTGTLDSICQEVLAQHRAPAEQPPVLIDSYLANTVLVRKGLFPGTGTRIRRSTRG